MSVPRGQVVAPSGDPLIDGLLQGSRWAPNELTYTFWDTQQGAWFSTGRELMRSALTEWSNVANITFREVRGVGAPNPNTADLDLFLVSSLPGGAAGLAEFPDPAISGHPGSIYLNLNNSLIQRTGTPGTEGYTVFIHEIGHTLGLKHPQDDGAAGRPTFAQLGIGHLDHQDYTVMSYNRAGPDSLTGNVVTPMLLDIEAIQYIYGANRAFHHGNDTYSLTTYGGTRTIWDGGGVDTINASTLTTGITINLNAGGFTEVSATSNYAVAFDVIIENAVGGMGHDRIIGNFASNTLTGGVGNDTIEGGNGVDTAAYLTVQSYYKISTSNGITTVSAQGTSEGTDTLIGIERLQFSDGALSLVNPINVAEEDSSDIFRFFNLKTGTHFYTASEYERDDILRRLPDMSYEGEVFEVPHGDVPGAVPVYRFFKLDTGTHFYTISEGERDHVLANLPIYSYEGAVFSAFDTKPSNDAHALYRFFNTASSTHFYTASEYERDVVTATIPAMEYEGVGMWIL